MRTRGPLGVTFTSSHRRWPSVWRPRSPIGFAKLQISEKRDETMVARVAAARVGRSESYWNATSAKLRSLRECKRSQSWPLSFSSAFNPISRCWLTR